MLPMLRSPDMFVHELGELESETTSSSSQSGFGLPELGGVDVLLLFLQFQQLLLFVILFVKLPNGYLLWKGADPHLQEKKEFIPPWSMA